MKDLVLKEAVAKVALMVLADLAVKVVLEAIPTVQADL
jgi:hypothetical protein